MEDNKKKSLIQYGVLAVVVMTLYMTGLHTEVIGFIQRGLLATGIMNPKVEVVSPTEATQSQPMANIQAADFNLQLLDIDGKVVSLEDLKGKVIFLNFWATWCPPCIAEMPNIAQLHEEMGDEVAFVMLSLDDDFEKAKAFNKRKGFNLPIYALASPLPAMYESSAIPTTYVIDAAGNLALTHKGMADYDNKKFKAFLKSLQ